MRLCKCRRRIPTIGVDDNGNIAGINIENDKRSDIQGSISEISPYLHCEMYAVDIDNKSVWEIGRAHV